MYAEIMTQVRTDERNAMHGTITHILSSRLITVRTGQGPARMYLSLAGVHI